MACLGYEKIERDHFVKPICRVHMHVLKLLNNDIHKISVTLSDIYRSVTEMLTASGVSWYSYEGKQTRPIKIIINNLHHWCSISPIVSDLMKQGLNVVNKLKWKTREPLNMFLSTFETNEVVKNIYEIIHILHTIVFIDPVRNSKLIPQCKNCQAFGHTKISAAKCQNALNAVVSTKLTSAKNRKTQML